MFENNPDNGNNKNSQSLKQGAGTYLIWKVRIMGVGLILLALLLAYLFIVLRQSGLDKNIDATVSIWGDKLKFFASLDVRRILLMMISGGLGSFIHTATSFGDYVGNEAFTSSWFWWYILRPFIGMMLAVIFYLVIRGGFLSGGTNAANINPFGVAALAGLVGMFSKQATDKLNEVFNTLFRTAPGEGDSKRKDNLTNPVPSISDFEPKSIEPMTNNLIVNIIGTGFIKGTVVRINGTNRETQFVDETKLTTKLLADDVQKEGELEVTVFNPLPGGGESAIMKLKIAKAI